MDTWRRYWKHPQAPEMAELDSPQATIRHAQIIREKPFLKRLYKDFYSQLRNICSVPIEQLSIIEIGSGGGMMKDVFPSVMTTDILDLPWIDVRCSATELPFQEQSVDGIFMFNVLHHLPYPQKIFSEWLRVLKPHGRVLLIEPANTMWARFIYKNFHHEPFHPHADWYIESGKPMSAANGALPWIIFERDQRKFVELFPKLRVQRIEYHTPFRYLLSGGVSMRSIVPANSYSLVNGFEKIMTPFNKVLGMFMTVEIKKI